MSPLIISFKDKEILKQALEKNLPLFEELKKEILELEHRYFSEFQELDEALQSVLVNDETVATENLAQVYMRELKKTKANLEVRAKLSFQELESNFLLRVKAV